MDDDAESIITNQRYAYINTVVGKAVKKKARVEHLTVSDKIDRIVTNLSLIHISTQRTRAAAPCSATMCRTPSALASWSSTRTARCV